MLLRYAPNSPYVRKVMVVAIEAGLQDRIEKVITDVTPLKEFEEVARENPLVKVPSLRTDEGVSLFDSRVICEYLDSLNNPNAAVFIGMSRVGLGSTPVPPLNIVSDLATPDDGGPPNLLSAQSPE